LSIFVFSLSASAKKAEVKKESSKKDKKSEVKKVTAEPKSKNIKLKGLEINLEKKEVLLDAKICLKDGLLEYLMCLPDTFEHESLLVTKTKPELLHTGLLLIGMDPYKGFMGIPGVWFENDKNKFNASLNIEIEMDIDGEKTRVKLVELLSYRGGDNYDELMNSSKEPDFDPDKPVTDSWIFTGSFFHQTKDKKKIYAANLGGVVTAIWPQPASVIQFGEEHSNPYQGENHGLEISGEHPLTVGANVKVVFSKKKTTPEQLKKLEKKEEAKKKPIKKEPMKKEVKKK
jgi:hypothetical protein